MAHGQPADSQVARRKRIASWLGLGAQCGLGGLLLYWMIASNQMDVGHILRRLGQIRPLPLALGCLCFALAMGASALRYRLFLPASVPLGYLLGAVLFQNALLTFVPARLGEVSYPLLLRRDHGIPLAKSVSVIAAVRGMDLIVVLLVAWWGSGQLRLALGAEWIVLALAALAVAGITGLWLAWRRGWAAGWLGNLLSAMTLLLDVRRLVGLAALSASIFCLTTLQSMWIVQSVALNMTFPHAALLNAMTLTAALLPIHPPGGWGTIDSIQVALLAYLGYPQADTTLAILSAHSFYTVLTFAGGGGGWLIRRASFPASSNGMRT